MGKVVCLSIVVVVLAISLHCCVGTPILDPHTVSTSLIDRILKSPNAFLNNYAYGQGIILDGIFDYSKRFATDKYLSDIRAHLDHFQNTKGQPAYNILRNISMAWGEAVGDIYLYTENYLNRIQYYNSSYPLYHDDLEVVNTVVYHYLLQFPRHLPNGTFSRDVGWSDQVDRDHSFIWADDEYMGLTLLARFAAYRKDSELWAKVAQFQLNYGSILGNPTSSNTILLSHGFNTNGNVRSCCKWGRANGWGIMSMTEILIASQSVAHNSHTQALEHSVRSLYKKFALGLQKVIDPHTGLLHQLVDVPSTFIETSASSMYLFSLLKGVEYKWIDRQEFDKTIQGLWKGLTELKIKSDGSVVDICEGTGIGDSVAFYNGRGRDYLDSAPGLGAVVRAAVAMASYST
eukprot:TRINITY_DN763_c0_g1_i1.p1 TRINITY_DN763_c0_g1~~TRINITY_DN763_c0_g1_i1.p1  ORF type:complete len:403 (-),score=41.81 TRINITY_DN763_c0_g1_i1:61-1269(-)